MANDGECTSQQEPTRDLIVQIPLTFLIRGPNSRHLEEIAGHIKAAIHQAELAEVP